MATNEHTAILRTDDHVTELVAIGLQSILTYFWPHSEIKLNQIASVLSPVRPFPH